MPLCDIPLCIRDERLGSFEFLGVPVVVPGGEQLVAYPIDLFPFVKLHPNCRRRVAIAKVTMVRRRIAAIRGGLDSGYSVIVRLVAEAVTPHLGGRQPFIRFRAGIERNCDERKIITSSTLYP